MARGLNRKNVLLTPKMQEISSLVGEQIRLARLRRKLTTETITERCGISRATLWKIEKGDGSVAMGYYLKVLHALNLEKDFLKLAADDELGRFLQDAELSKKGRRRKSDK